MSHDNYLNMDRYRVEKLPTREKSNFEKWLSLLGMPLAILVFFLIYHSDLAFLQHLDAANLSKTALHRFEVLGPEKFSQANISLLAIFAAALILWTTESIPSYLTSLYLIVAIVLTGVTSEKEAYFQLGHPVMWLNILSFVLASMLVKTRAAKRFALWFIIKFGKSPGSLMASFLVINLVLSLFISATTAKATILLPIFMLVAAVYGAFGGKKRNNFGRNLVLQNLFQINMSATGFITGSGANLLAGALIAGAIGMQTDFPYVKWLVAALPLCLILMFLGWLVGSKIFFPLKEEEKVPQIPGGMDRLRDELESLGPISRDEMKAVFIFVAVLVLWVTDTYHGISATAVAFLGSVVALTPRIGVVKWNDVDIPWHLLLFSAGAYTLGAGLEATDLAGTLVAVFYKYIGFTAQTPFWVIYLFLTGAMIFSSIMFESKTMRTLIFVPIAIGTAKNFGLDVLSLALPVALLIEHVYALPFNSKPAALLYLTDQYSWTDTAKFGLTMLVLSWFVIILWGETWLRWIGVMPNGVFY